MAGGHFSREDAGSRRGFEGPPAPIEASELMVALTAGLRLPLPIRTQLLLELRQDLEGLATTLEDRGATAEEARRQAAETILPDEGVLRALERQKAPLYRRLTREHPSAALRRAERFALTLATVALLGLEASALLRAGLLEAPSPFLLPVLALGAAAVGGVIAKAFQLWVKGAHHDPRGGLTAIAALAALTLFVGFTGTLVDFVVLAGVLEAAPENQTALLMAWLIRSAALLSAAIILAVAGGVGWLVLIGWTTHQEVAHQEALRAARGLVPIPSPRSSTQETTP